MFLTYNYKLFFKYIFLYKNQIFFKNFFKNEKQIQSAINSKTVYYLSLHLKLSSLFYSTQLVDMFAYDNVVNRSSKNLAELAISKLSLHNSILNSLDTTFVVYNFHNYLREERFFFFILQNNTPIKQKLSKSITDLFFNAWWLEREISELNKITFAEKKDTRNLMLIYGDTTAPFKKSFPSLGLKEIFYDSLSDQVIYTSPIVQF